jgi:hypothetical protein
MEGQAVEEFRTRFMQNLRVFETRGSQGQHQQHRYGVISEQSYHCRITVMMQRETD